MKRVSEAERAGLNLTWSEIPKTHFRMAWLICIDPSLLNYAISTQIWPMYFQEFSWTDIANIYDASSFLGRLSGQSLQVRVEIVYIYDLNEVEALQVRADIASIYDASTLPGRLQ